jgi:hypothetical protein
VSILILDVRVSSVRMFSIARLVAGLFVCKKERPQRGWVLGRHSNAQAGQPSACINAPCGPRRAGLASSTIFHVPRGGTEIASCSLPEFQCPTTGINAAPAIIFAGRRFPFGTRAFIVSLKQVGRDRG